jgi:hypothetical protein
MGGGGYGNITTVIGKVNGEVSRERRTWAQLFKVFGELPDKDASVP